MGSGTSQTALGQSNYPANGEHIGFVTRENLVFRLLLL